MYWKWSPFHLIGIHSFYCAGIRTSCSKIFSWAVRLYVWALVPWGAPVLLPTFFFAPLLLCSRDSSRFCLHFCSSAGVLTSWLPHLSNDCSVCNKEHLLEVSLYPDVVWGWPHLNLQTIIGSRNHELPLYCGASQEWKKRKPGPLYR